VKSVYFEFLYFLSSRATVPSLVLNPSTCSLVPLCFYFIETKTNTPLLFTIFNQ